MSLGIVCDCEGLLSKQGSLAVCRWCRKTYPTADLEQILKLLAKADYEPAAADQTPPTEQEKRSALNMAARKLAKLKLRVVDLEKIRPRPSPPQVPAYWQPIYTTTATTTVGWGWGGSVSSIYVRVTIG